MMNDPELEELFQDPAHREVVELLRMSHPAAAPPYAGAGPARPGVSSQRDLSVPWGSAPFTQRKPSVQTAVTRSRVSG